MRCILGSVVLAIVVGLPTRSSADFVVDDFSTGQNTNTSKSINVGESDEASRETLSTSIGGGIAITDDNKGSDHGGIEWDYTNTLNLSGNQYAVLRGVLTSSTGHDLTAVLRLTWNSLVLGKAGVVADQQHYEDIVLTDSETGDLYVDISGISDLANTTSISLQLFADDPGTFTLEFGAFELTAVPEPASFALMGLALTSAGGVNWVRRRRKEKADS